MEITGKIKLINDTEKFDSGFRKREVVITTNGEYPEHIKVEFIQDKCDVLNDYKVGDEVNVGINLKGREWINPQKEAVYFNTIMKLLKRKLQLKHKLFQRMMTCRFSCLNYVFN